MKTNQTYKKALKIIIEKAHTGNFAGFKYRKTNGEESVRVVRFGVKIAEKMERVGTPVSGKGNWHKGMESGFRGIVIKRGKDRYVRGVDAKDGKFKLFSLSGISNLK